MPYTKDQLRTVYLRTDGHCHLCHCKLAFTNHGAFGAKGAWEIEHSRARRKGGTDHGNNLKPACLSCNRIKGTLTTRTVRGWNGVTRAPLSRARKDTLREEYVINGVAIGGAIGLAFGPVGAMICATVGALVGADTTPPKA